MSAEEQNVMALIVLLDAGLYAAAAGSRRGIHVRDKAKRRFFARELRVDITVLAVVVGIQPHLAEFPVQKGCQIVLLGCGRLRVGVLR